MARTLVWTEAKVVAAGNDLRLLVLHSDEDIYLCPSFQLQDGNVVEGLQEVLLVLQTGVNSPWTWAQWLNGALPEEDPPRNLQRLFEGPLDETIRDAEHVAPEWSS
ncbi:hypothetical protein [Microbacterium sp. Leaf320]|uniref:hypothetical protein n=1 Tax=Microbacterium sp. Leaf320 TaxID=1736334 RepID=UPI0006F8CB13|nr:hypothetical protein [Microbacterium sp. Leaf320]KQQ65400.1 hypothetical protein ASF63_15810 [Microbacterium sp. Leaf320]